MMTRYCLLFCFFFSYLPGNGKDSFSGSKKYPATTGKASQTTFFYDTVRRSENPVIPGDFADPSVIRKGNVYYAAGTSSEWAPHYPLYQSNDLLHWQSIGYVFPQTPSWASASFWAPELFYRNGTYYVYYVARRKSDGVSCIGVATSQDPAKGFTDKGVLLPFGKEAIDPFVIEDGGQLYITWKAYGLDDRPIEILGSRLSDDGLKVVGEPFMLLRDDEKKGLEGQCLVKRNGYYYLLYSAGACCGGGCSYEVDVARATSLRGPYVRYGNNPVLSETEEWKCTGHGTVVTNAEGADYYLYHAYSKEDDVYTGRQGMLGKISWDAADGWPRIAPLGKEVSIEETFRDEFSGSQLSGNWQWDFRHGKPHCTVKNGNLYLTGDTGNGNPTGAAVTVRPLTGDYQITTEVINQNTALKGLVLYGDADESAGIGIANDTIQVWQVKKGERRVLAQQPTHSRQPMQFTIEVEKGRQCRFYWREKGKDRSEIQTGDSYYDASFLPPWDRSPRPGLLHRGAASEPAVFSFFNISYQ